MIKGDCSIYGFLTLVNLTGIDVYFSEEKGR